MCGIIGMYGKGDVNIASAMMRNMHHRGPDENGLHECDGTVLAHTRLSILDLECGRQPMVHGKTSITFNGEVYNYRELALKYLPGQVMKGHSDTEVLLHLYRKLGPQMTELLDGMFALAIVSDGELFLARDPIGIKPLYYGKGPQGFCFASEVRTLAMTTGDINEFPAGHWYHSKLGWKKYYSVPEAQNGFTGDEEAAKKEIRAVLAAAVQKRMLSDVPVGISLSGGLDSSIIALLAAERTEHLHSFAVGMTGSEDLKAARLVAEQLKTRHHEYVYTEEDMLAALPEVVKHLESVDPALVRSAIPNHFLAKLASQYVKVMLTGEGADELYAGYDYMASYEDPAELHKELVRTTAALHNTNLQRADRIPMAYSLEARVPFLDVHSIATALAYPAAWKLHQGRPAKHLLREAFRNELPHVIIDRPKQKFSKGAGSSDVIKRLAESSISDAEFLAEQQRLQATFPQALPNKEALLYYRHLASEMRDEWLFPVMGNSASL